MSCLDVMYQVYGPHQPYFATAYTPYHQVRACPAPQNPRAGTSGGARASLHTPPPRAEPRGPGRLRCSGPRRATRAAGAARMPGLPALPPGRRANPWRLPPRKAAKPR